MDYFFINPTLFLPLAHAIRGVTCTVTLDMHSPYHVAQGYYGSTKAIARDEPLSLLRRALAEYVATLPLLRMLVTGNEPPRISNSMGILPRNLKRKVVLLMN